MLMSVCPNASVRATLWLYAGMRLQLPKAVQVLQRLATTGHDDMQGWHTCAESISLTHDIH
jgi:hypothetical protein